MKKRMEFENQRNRILNQLEFEKTRDTSSKLIFKKCVSTVMDNQQRLSQATVLLQILNTLYSLLLHFGPSIRLFGSLYCNIVLWVKLCNIDVLSKDQVSTVKPV
jgi:hypothetical protein